MVNGAGSYADVSGTTNRAVVIFAWTNEGTTTLASVTWNGYTVSATATNSDAGSTMGWGFSVFTDSQLPGSSKPVTINWTTAPGGYNWLAVTVDNVNQSSPVRTSSAPATQFGTAPKTTLTGLTVGDLVIGQVTLNTPSRFSSWQNSLVQIFLAAASGGGQDIAAAYKTAASASEVFGTNETSNDYVFIGALALAGSGGGGPTYQPLPYVRPVLLEF